MKICKNCITEIDKNCKRCPNCGKNPNKESKTLEIFCIVLMFFILLIMGGGVFYYFKGNDVNFNFSKKAKENVNTNVKASFLKGEKKHICKKEEKDEDSTSSYKYEIIVKNDKVQSFESEQLVKFNDNTGLDLALGFIKMFTEAFNQVDGMSANTAQIDDSSYKFNMKVDYDKLDFSKLKNVFNSPDSDKDAEMDLKMYKDGITYNEFKSSLDGYTCD